MGGITLFGVYLSSEGEVDGPSLTLERPVPRSSDAPPATWDRVRVEVLNAGGIRGVAGEARDRLRERRFDVVYYGNAPAFDRETSLVLDRTGMEGAALEVARALGIRRVEVAPDTTVYVDVTVLLGTDWSPDGVLEEDEEIGAAHGRSRWDPRRLFMNR